MRTKSNLLKAVLSVVVLLGVVMIATAPEVSAQPVPFETIEKGDSSRFFSDGASFLFTDRPAWERFWRIHRPGWPVPDVRFPQENVAVVLLGTQATTGRPATEIVMVERINKETRIHVWEDHRDGPGLAISNPFHIVKVPRTNTKGSVSFVRREVHQ